MSKLSTMIRPQVVFDPKVKEHRQYLNKYIAEKSWKDCPVRFVTTESTNEVVNTIQRQLLEFYSSQEFNN